MAGLFSRLKIWNKGETVKAQDLNGEFNHFLSKIDVSNAEGYSRNLSQMQSTEDPGAEGSEDLAQPISNQQELQRIRYMLNLIIGGGQWYSPPVASIQTLSGTSYIPRSRVISGRVNASEQPDFIRALGAGGVKLLATATPLVVAIDGQEYTFSSDITLAGLSAGFSSNHTTNSIEVYTGIDGAVAGEKTARYFRDQKEPYIRTSATGSNIVSRVGQIACFKVSDVSLNDDYLIARITDAGLGTYVLEDAKRAFFFDSSGVAVDQATLTAGNIFTLLKITYLFLDTSGNLSAVYSEPFVQSTAPTSFTSGDRWFDTTNETWKKYNGSSWVQANEVMVGMCAQDDTGCVVSRSSDIYKNFSDHNTINFYDYPVNGVPGAIVSSKGFAGSISVYGRVFNYVNSLSWDLANDLDSGLVFTAGWYFLYITNNGKTVISDVHPNDRYSDLKGYYHPTKPWRCVGAAKTSAGPLYSTNLNEFIFFRQDQSEGLPDMSVELRNLMPRSYKGAYLSPAPLNAMARSAPVDLFLLTAQTTTSLTPVDINNQSVDISVGGKRPVVIGFSPDDENGTLVSGFAVNSNSGAGVRGGIILILRGSTVIARMPIGGYSDGSIIRLPCGSFACLDYPPSGGTYTYKAQMLAADANTVVSAQPANRLFAYEMA